MTPPNALTAEAVWIALCDLCAANHDYSKVHRLVLVSKEQVFEAVQSLTSASIAGSGWRDIASAPKDGTRFLGFARGVDPDDNEPWESYKVVYWEPAGFYGSGPCFMGGNLPANPTHWRPVFAPPKQGCE